MIRRLPVWRTDKSMQKAQLRKLRLSLSKNPKLAADARKQRFAARPA